MYESMSMKYETLIKNINQMNTEYR